MQAVSPQRTGMPSSWINVSWDQSGIFIWHRFIENQCCLQQTQAAMCSSSWGWGTGTPKRRRTSGRDSKQSTAGRRFGKEGSFAEDDQAAEGGGTTSRDQAEGQQPPWGPVGGDHQGTCSHRKDGTVLGRTKVAEQILGEQRTFVEDPRYKNLT